jgi:hypothetical protein
MRTLFLALAATTVGVIAGFWIAPPFGTFAILAKPSAK